MLPKYISERARSLCELAGLPIHYHILGVEGAG